jgi:hypothetical protein
MPKVTPLIKAKLKVTPLIKAKLKVFSVIAMETYGRVKYITIYS